jgi:hypothetical protein
MAALRPTDTRAGRSRRTRRQWHGALGYAGDHGWTIIKSRGGPAHAWGVTRCPGGCRQVSAFSTPRVPEDHARALRRAVDRCPHSQEPEDNG